MSLRRDGQRLRLVLDATGSVRATVDAGTGQVLQRLSYDAYGRVTSDTNPGLQPFGYKGSLSDPVAEGAGLVWMGVRAYTPKLARFTTPDPAGLAAGWNEHDALAGDPINLIDADGRFVALLVPLVPFAVMAVDAAVAATAATAALYGTVWALNQAIDLCLDQFGDDDENPADGDAPPAGPPPPPVGDLSGTKQSATKIGKAARQAGLTPKQVEDAIHDLKQELPGGGFGDASNPDVHVGPDGDVYPVGPGGILGDSLGNLNDYN